MVKKVQVFNFLLIVTTFSIKYSDGFPQSLSHVQVAETPIENNPPENEIFTDNKENNLNTDSFHQKPSNVPPKNGPPKNFAVGLTNFFKKFLPTNNHIKNTDDVQKKLLLGNRHIYLELLHQFTPYPWFKPFYDKITAIQGILKDPNFSLPNDTVSLGDNGQGTGSSFGCGWFPNSVGVFPPKDDPTSNGEVDENKENSTSRSTSGGSKFVAFGSRPAAPFNYNFSPRKSKK